MGSKIADSLNNFWGVAVSPIKTDCDNLKNQMSSANQKIEALENGTGGGGSTSTYKKMTVKIDLSNSNPATCCTYADDAEEMTPGSDAWDEFFGHYPVMLLNGVEGQKLNPFNFGLHEDGTPADITSGAEGDVMIAFPRRGLKISTLGNIVTISMTNNPADVNFEYLAHKRGNTSKDVFYLGAYKGYEQSSKLRSLSGKAPTSNKTIGAFRTLARANGAADGNGGSGYDQSGFYQLTFRQAMYLLKYKTLDSQAAVGRGYVDTGVSSSTYSAASTGGTNTKGMDYGESGGLTQMKLFGLEDFWGNIYEWIDGLFCNANYHILTASENFNDTGSGYEDQGQGATANIGNYMSKPQGTTKTGFIAKEVSGSASTYFCDYAVLYASGLPCFGGDWGNASDTGAFRLNVAASASGVYPDVAARLMYL